MLFSKDTNKTRSRMADSKVCKANSQHKKTYNMTNKKSRQRKERTETVNTKGPFILLSRIYTVVTWLKFAQGEAFILALRLPHEVSRKTRQNLFRLCGEEEQHRFIVMSNEECTASKLLWTFSCIFGEMHIRLPHRTQGYTYPMPQD